MIDSDAAGTRKINNRRSHKKSHLGCATCKRRRIKCDENLPVCGPCTKSKLKCPYVELNERELERIVKSKELQNSYIVLSPNRSPEPKPATTTAPLNAFQNQQQQQQQQQKQQQATTKKFQPQSSTPPVNYQLPPIHSLTSPDYGLSGPASPADSSSISGSSTRLPSITSFSTLSDQMEIPTPASKNTIVQQGFETDMIRTVYLQWMSTVLHTGLQHSGLFHALMAFSQGFYVLRYPGNPKLRDSAERHRFIALQELQEELAKPHFEQVDALLATSLLLSWDFFFEDGNIESYIYLSRGLAAMLEKAQLAVAITPTAMCMRDALFQSIKAIQLPPYDTRFLAEFLTKALELGPLVQASTDVVLQDEYQYLCTTVTQVCDFLTANPTRPNLTASGISYHSPAFLFRVLRTWLRNFPSRALSPQGRSNPADVPLLIVYTYFHALSRALDAIFPEVRYMFQFSFIGPVDLTGMENVISDLIGSGTPSEYPLNQLMYPKQVLSFFKERLFLLNRMLQNKADLLSSRELTADPITETFLTSFDIDKIPVEAFPVLLSDKLNDMEEAARPRVRPSLPGVAAQARAPDQVQAQVQAHVQAHVQAQAVAAQGASGSGPISGLSQPTSSARVSPGVLSRGSPSKADSVMDEPTKMLQQLGPEAVMAAYSAASAYGVEVYREYFEDRIEILRHI